MNWNFQRKGRAWVKEEAWAKYELPPEKKEMFEGKIFWSDEQRLNMIGLLLENVGIDKMLDLFGDLSLLKDAIKEKERGNG